MPLKTLFFLFTAFASSISVSAQSHTTIEKENHSKIPPLKKQVPTKVVPVRPQAKKIPEHRNIRVERPFSLSLAVLGKHPIVGGAADFQLFKYLGLGAGFSYFSIGAVTGYFIPVYLRGTILDYAFTPYVDFGLDFVSVKFQSTNSLLRSSFQGTQVIVGGGLEYRFKFGLVTRINGIYFINAKIMAPGAEVGYSFLIN